MAGSDDARSDSRAPLLAALAAHVPTDAREAAMAGELRAFVEREPRCFERSTLEGHITGSAWIVDACGEAAVLTHHRKLDRWLQLGGHADGESDVAAVAEREAREESGLASLRRLAGGVYDVDVHVIPARPGEPEHRHYDVRYAFVADRAEPPVASDESHAVAWVPLAELGAYGADASVLRLAAKTTALVAGGVRRGSLRS